MATLARESPPQTAPRKPCDADDLAELAKRLGNRGLRKRLLKQADKWAKTAHQGEGPFLLERLLPLDKVITCFLKCTGTYGWGRRNFMDVRVVENIVHMASLRGALRELRILHLSDLHLDLDPTLTDVIIERLKGLDYDLAVITGDFRNSCTSNYAEAMELTGRVIAALNGPRFGILGNHDFIEMVPELERLGLPMLLNESLVLKLRGQRVLLAGIDDPHFYRTDNFDAFEKWSWGHDLRVLLSHSPESYALAARSGFDFMMSGHTHGGQICLPGGIPIMRNGNCPPSMRAGPWVYAGLTGYTSRGTGGCGVPVRYFCPPEITIHRMVRGDQD